MRWRGIQCSFTGVALLLVTLEVAALDGPLIAAAASLRAVLPDILELYAGHPRPRITYSSSGDLYRQIQQGAPYELFLSADTDYAIALAEKGFAVDAGVVYARGRLALFIPAGSPLVGDVTLEDLRSALADGRLERFAIANPAHAPYGAAAVDVLEAKGLWELIHDRLVVGENAAQTLQFMLAGGVQGGLVPVLYAYSPKTSRLGSFTLLPGEWHRTLDQRMVLLRPASPAARELYELLQSSPARAVFVRYGLEPPNSESSE